MGKINDFGFPFTSVTGDRQYSAGEWRDYFSSLVTNGVVSETLNKLKINQQASANKTVFVDTGSVVINGCMRILDTTQNITITDNTSGNPRIDRIVARLNYTDRKIEFAVLTGTPAGSPVAPTLTQNTTVWEISLAQIAVANGFSTIIAGNITDQRTYMQYNIEPYTSDKYFGKYSLMTGGTRITNGVVPFTTESHDDFLAINLGTSTSRITIPAGISKIKLSSSGIFSTTNGAILYSSMALLKNGVDTDLPFGYGYPINAKPFGYSITSIPLTVSAGDYFEISFNGTNCTVASATLMLEVIL